MLSRLRFLADLTPRETCRIVRRKYFSASKPWTENELLLSPKYSRGIRFAEFLLRQEAILKRELDWQPINFDDCRVVEVGCGPLAGFGPLALFCGAQSFESADPEWQAELFFSDQIRERYLPVLHADLTALFGARCDFSGFLKRLRSGLHIYTGPFEEAPIVPGIDVVLSQSVLEHVSHLDRLVAHLKYIQKPDAKFIHMVDFGNHYPTASPFDGLYDNEPQYYFAKRGLAINLKRSSDIESIFNDSSIPCRLVETRVLNDGLSQRVHAWWARRYAQRALVTQHALIVSMH